MAHSPLVTALISGESSNGFAQGKKVGYESTAKIVAQVAPWQSKWGRSEASPMLAVLPSAHRCASLFATVF